MVSDEKLIKQGIRYTDALFKELENRLRQGVISSDTLEAFLEKTKGYTSNNPLVTTGYGSTLTKIILAETNNHKFSRPAQKELVRVTIENQVGDLITNVGEDIKADVRDIVKEGYNNNLSQDEIADNISKRINVIKNTRARTIARTEIARAATVSDYIINKERGANYFVVDCRSTRCPVCKEAYCKNSEIGGDVEYDIDDVEMLPPKHPNCRCVAVFGIDPKRKKTKPTEDTAEEVTTQTTTSTKKEPPTNLDINGNKLLTSEELAKMNFESLAEHHGATYEGVKVYDYDGRKYHQFKQSFNNGEELTIYFENGAIKSYTKKGIATPNEIVNEVLKVPEVLKRETNEIWFKNTNQGIQHKFASKSKYDNLGSRVGGYNLCNYTHSKGRIHNGKTIDDPDHKIVINPKYFKGAKGKFSTWEKDPTDARNWKMTIYHEFTHSIDMNRERWKTTNTSHNASQLCFSDEYSKIFNEERYFTWYANTQRQEAFCEHGGYVSYMLENPEEQSKLIEIKRIDKGEVINEEINFEQYKKLYPKHYDYFTRLFDGKVEGVYNV